LYCLESTNFSSCVKYPLDNCTKAVAIHHIIYDLINLVKLYLR